jgi:hypothetical protein
MLENEDYLLSKKGKGLRTLLYLFTTPEGPAAFLVLMILMLVYISKFHVV